MIPPKKCPAPLPQSRKPALTRRVFAFLRHFGANPMPMLIRHYDATRMDNTGNGTLQTVEPPKLKEPLAALVTGVTVTSAAFEYDWISFQTDVACYVDFGLVPLASAATSFLHPAGPVFTYAVQRGHKLQALGV
jgi:hypothetical protein